MDEIYIRKVLEGDSKAFRHLITKYKDMAYSLAMSVLKDGFYADEALQSSFLIAFEKLNTFTGSSKFSTWLYRIVINECFKLARKNKSGFINYMEILPDVPQVIDSSILKLAEDDQKYIINEALKLMSPQESLSLRLFYLEENSINEICELTGWSGPKVKVVLYRARINLKFILTKIYKLDKKGLYE